MRSLYHDTLAGMPSAHGWALMPIAGGDCAASQGIGWLWVRCICTMRVAWNLRLACIDEWALNGVHRWGVGGVPIGSMYLADVGTGVRSCRREVAMKVRVAC